MKEEFSLLKICWILCLAMLKISAVSAQDALSTYQQKIIEYTTDDRFLPESVLSIPDHPSIPSPLQQFGYIIGEPGLMHHTNKIYGYYKVLEANTSKLKMMQIGTSEEGRPINLVIISSEVNMLYLERYREYINQLADPRKINKNEAEQIIQDGKIIYFLNGGMHSAEMGSPETLMELAYRLVADDSESIQKILDNCIILINPVSEPDGRDKQVDWYYRYTKDRAEYDDAMPRSSPYWGKYVFHDNNRDGLQITQEITKALFKIYFDWHPNIMLDLHESVPLLYISTGTGPYNEHVDPVTIGEWQTLANHEMSSLAAQGLPGVFDWAFYDGWWPGYGIWVANNHNSIGRFYETFGNAGANTYLRDITRSKFAGAAVTSREWYRPDPSTGKLYWSSRNNVNFTEAGILASLQFAADNRTTLLQNFYQKGLNGINFAKDHDTKMFVIPSRQRDPFMAAYLVNQLQKQGIEVKKVKNENEYVVTLDQPYSRFAYDLLTEQHYPAEAEFPPYDAIAWTLGYMYGVDVQNVDSMYADNTLQLLEQDVNYDGKVDTEALSYILENKAQSSIISALYKAQHEFKKFKAEIVDSLTITGIDTIQPGTIFLSGLTKSQFEVWARESGLDLRAGNIETTNKHLIQLPKIAVYHSWTSTQAEGWVRYTFEQKGVPYTSIDKDDLKEGMLNERFDVIIIPDQGGDLSNFINGVEDRFGPIAYTKTPEYTAMGTPDSSEDITGGPGFYGMNNLKKFVKDGGVLIPLENSAAIIADAGFTHEVNSFAPGGLFHPGSIVTAKSRNSKSPILYGFPETFHLFKGNSKLLSTEKYDRNLVVAQYGTEKAEDEQEYTGAILGREKIEGVKNTPDEKSDSKEAIKKEDRYVISGMVRNEKTIIGQAAIINVPLEKGRVVYFTFNPLNRYLNHHDAALLWNALISWNHL